METSATTRHRTASILAEEPFDLLVVGGGIVGAGIARDAALRGLRTALVEQHDFAFGTSSRSSRLLHGGIRYLAQGHVWLVRQASREKRILRTIAPHLAEPLAFVFPTYRRGPWPKWKLRLGVRLYDLLAGKNLGRSRTLSRTGAVELLPGLNPEGLNGAVRYYDAKTNDARLVLDTLRSARKGGAVVLNYAALEEATPGDPYWTCRIRDSLTEDPFTLRAKGVVNATGPWSDRLVQSQTKLRLSKGVHLVVDRQRLPMPDAVVMPYGQRILFAIPWCDRVILGTTDTEFDGSLEAPGCSQSDVEYVLKAANQSFPHAKLQRDDVICNWSGVRPLLYGEGGTSDISRTHEITMHANGWCDVAGGKLTTYRLMAEQAVDRLVRHFGFSAGPSVTAAMPLLEVDETAGISAIDPPPIDQRAVRHYCQHEWVTSLDDVMTRRTGWRFYHHQQAELAERVARWMAEELGWSDSQQQTELENYLRI